MKIFLSKLPNGEGEIYQAIQGEGPSMGKHVVFVRLAFCDLTCSFCDSWYTWHFEGSGPLKIAHRFAQPVKREDYVLEMDVLEVAQKIIELCGPHFKRVVFTGGEPMLQQKAISEIVSVLKKDYHHFEVEVETNGTVKVLDDCKFMTQINCSPKLESSGNTKEARNKPDVISQYLSLFRSSDVHHLAFKFVVHKDKMEDDLAEIEAWEDEHKVPRGLIWLMPEGTDRDRIAECTDALMPVCRERGYNLTTRLHILLYGSKRAV